METLNTRKGLREVIDRDLLISLGGDGKSGKIFANKIIIAGRHFRERKGQKLETNADLLDFYHNYPFHSGWAIGFKTYLVVEKYLQEKNLLFYNHRFEGLPIFKEEPGLEDRLTPSQRAKLIYLDDKRHKVQEEVYSAGLYLQKRDTPILYFGSALDLNDNVILSLRKIEISNIVDYKPHPF